VSSMSTDHRRFTSFEKDRVEAALPLITMPSRARSILMNPAMCFLIVQGGNDE
jgi:hypothetical protein